MSFQITREVVNSQSLAFVKAAHIFNTLSRCGGDVGISARVLGKTTESIRRYMRDYGISIGLKTRLVFWPEDERERLS